MTDPVLAHKTEDGRFYTHPHSHNEVPSITNIKDVMGIKGLMYWASGECATYAADNKDKLVNLDRDDVYKLVKGAPWSKKGKKNQSSLIGDIVHDWVDQFARGAAVDDIDTSFYVNRFGEEQTPPVQAKWTWNQFSGNGDSFINVYKPAYEFSEFTVFSDKYNYAGTMDGAARVGGKRLYTLIDNKTGNNVYDDMAIQLAAGQYADYILIPDADAENGWRQVELPHFDAYGILHLRPRGWSLVPLRHIPEAFQAFLGLKAAFEWKINCKDDTVGMSPKYSVRASR